MTTNINNQLNCNPENIYPSQITNQFNGYQILQRDHVKTTENSTDAFHIIYPKIPYHIKWEWYVTKRNEIFNDLPISEVSCKRQKRSTTRLRKFYKNRKICSKLLISAILSNSNDQRYYAKISFLNFSEFGLLDTGASISCIGSELAQKDFSNFPNFSKCKTYVKTADGKSQKVIGWLNVNVTFKDKQCPLNLFIIPSISQRVILGIDFWKKFDLIPNIIETVDIVDKSVFSIDFPKSSDLKSDRLSVSSVLKSDNLSDSKYTPIDEESNESYSQLTSNQRQQLEAVISLFPNFEKQG